MCNNKNLKNHEEYIMNYKEKAECLFKQGYNCSQAVFAAFCDKYNMSRDTALKISVPFGGGMGRMREVCGAVSGMLMAYGMIYGTADPNQKGEHYKNVQMLAEQFKKEHGSLICRELLGVGNKPESSQPEKRTATYYKKRPCVEIVGCAAQVLEDYISKNPLH